MIGTLTGQKAATTGTGVVGWGTFYGPDIVAGAPKLEPPDVKPVISFDPGQPSAGGQSTGVVEAVDEVLATERV
jgi:hypothetical protein